MGGFIVYEEACEISLYYNLHINLCILESRLAILGTQEMTCNEIRVEPYPSRLDLKSLSNSIRI